MSPVKFSSKIVGYNVVKEEDIKYDSVTPEITPVITPAPKLLTRDELLNGSTYKIKTPTEEHALYITINNKVVNEGQADEKIIPFEIFCNSKNVAHFQWVTALTILISAIFRKGGDVSFITDELKSVFDPKGGYFKKGGLFVPSVVAEIGYVLEEHFKKIGAMQGIDLDEHQQKLIADKKAEYSARQEQETTPEVNEFPASATLCEKCQVKAVIVMDGCKTCLNCGDSKCG